MFLLSVFRCLIAISRDVLLDALFLYFLFVDFYNRLFRAQTVLLRFCRGSLLLVLIC